MLREEEAERVREAVLRIPPQYRLILVLHDMEELPTEDVASITGLTENTIRVRLHRARLFVRKELVKRTGNERASACAENCSQREWPKSAAELPRNVCRSFGLSRRRAR